MTKKRVLTSMLLILAASLAFANGQQESSAKAGSKKDSKISFMWWGNESRNLATIKAAEDFMADNPDVKVENMPNPFDGYHDKIIVQLANGTAADLMCYSTEWMTEVGFEPNPALLDLNMVKDLIDTSGIDAGILSGGSANGKLLGIPTAISGVTISSYDNAMDAYIKKTGAPALPTAGDKWTFDDFIAYGKNFHEAMGPDCYFLDFGGDYSGLNNSFCWALSEIGNGPYLDSKCNVNFTEEDLKKTYELFLEMSKTGVMAPGTKQVEILSGVSTRDADLAAGKYALVLHWTSNIQENSKKSKSEMSVVAYPQLGRPENDGVFTRPAQFWAINAKSKDKEAAARLLNYIMNDPKAIMDLKLERGVPATQIGRDTLAKEGILSGTISDATDYLVKSADAGYNWFIRVPLVLTAIDESYVNVILGKISPAEAAKTAYAQIQKITKELREDNKIN